MKVVLLVFLSLFLTSCDGAGSRTDNNKNILTILTVDGAEHVFNIELALTPDVQAQGLMYRTEMPEDAGMLFYFGQEAERGFWMKNTLIPLDMFFIKADGIIHHIHENAIPNDLTSIRSQGPVAAVLEINGGMSAQLKISPGDKVLHPVFELKQAQ